MADRPGAAVYSRTRPEYVGLILRTFALAVLGAGGLATIVQLVTSGIGNGFGGASGVHGVGWVAVGGVAAVVGCAVAACVAVFARPRLVLTRDIGGARVSAGYGELWTGVAPVAGDGGPSGSVATVTE